MELLRSRDALASALSAAMADSVSTSVLFPLDSVKIRMGAHNLSFADAVADVVRHGDMYTGVGIKLLQGFQQKFQYFYSYAILKALFEQKLGRKPSVPADLALGYVAALQGLGSTLPLEVTNVRVITAAKSKEASSVPGHGFLRTFADIVEHEGLLSLYRTLPASAMLCINPAITYVFFEELKSKRLEANRVRDGGAKAAKAAAMVLTTLEALVVGIISKSIAVVLTFPLMRAKLAMSVWAKKRQAELAAREAKGEDVSAQERAALAPGLAATLRAIVATDGAAGLFAGLAPALVKGVLNATLMLVVKERVYTSVRALVAEKRQ